MKARSKILTKAVVLVLLAALTLMLSISAAAAGSTTLTTTVPETVTLALEIQGKGSVTVNGVSYSRSAEVVLPRGEDFLLQVQSAEGYETETVIYNGQDITDLLGKEEIILSARNTQLRLQVVFTKKAAGPVTGDLRLHTVLTAMGISALCLAMLLTDQKKKRNL